MIDKIFYSSLVLLLALSYTFNRTPKVTYTKLHNTIQIDPKAHNPFDKGQYTWFVYGAVKQELGINLKFSQNYGHHANKWHELLDLPLYKEPRANSIAIYDWKEYDHVAFIVDTFKDNIVFRETNTKTARDGKLQVRNKYIHNEHLIGYLYL